MKRLSSVLVAAALVVSVLQVAAPTAHAGGGATHYLALGDSVAVGIQPNRGRTPGYVRRVYSDLREQTPDLSLQHLACPGETTRAMLEPERSACDWGDGTQLSTAVDFLEAQVGDVTLITITIGANDVVGRCLDLRTGEIDKACVVDLRPHLRHRVSLIIDALSTAAPGVPIVGMTYYNPFLGLWAIFPEAKQVTRANARAWSVFNGALTTAYENAGATAADVAATFQVDNFTDTVVQPGLGELPVNVAHACGWTWFCSRKYFGDPHPNAKGYEKTATTFIRELRGLLP